MSYLEPMRKKIMKMMMMDFKGQFTLYFPLTYLFFLLKRKEDILKNVTLYNKVVLVNAFTNNNKQ